MNDERRESVVRSQRVPTRHVLKIKRKPIRYPNTRLHRAATALLGPDGSVRATDMDFDHPSIRRVPTYGCLPYDPVARDRNGIRIGGQRRTDRRTRRIDRGPTDITLERIRPRICEILNIDTAARRIIHRYLDRRISHHEISPEKVTLHSRCEKDTVRVSENGILLDNIPRIDRSRKTNTKV